MTIRIRMLKTRVPHWGCHAGLHRFVHYLDPARFTASTYWVSDSDADLPLPNSVFRERLRNYVQRSGMQWYKLSDLAAELRTLPRVMLNNVDIVHYLDGEHTAQYVPSWLRKWGRSGTKTIATFHQPVRLLDELINPQIVAKLDHVNVVSPTQTTYFLQHLPAERISVVLHGIDTEFFRPKPQHSNRKAFRCLSAGFWLRDWKAIRAVAARLKSEAGLEFHIIANWPTGMEDLDNIRIHASISDEALLSMYQQCDVLLLPLTDATANNTILEAIACGLPVISTNLEAVKTYLPGPEALLVEGNSVDQLTEAVLHLKQNPDVRQRMADRARQRAEELSWEKITPQYEQIYADLFAGRL